MLQSDAAANLSKLIKDLEDLSQKAESGDPMDIQAIMKQMETADKVMDIIDEKADVLLAKMDEILAQFEEQS
jgi:hypothetical protein